MKAHARWVGQWGSHEEREVWFQLLRSREGKSFQGGCAVEKGGLWLRDDHGRRASERS